MDNSKEKNYLKYKTGGGEGNQSETEVTDDENDT